MGYVWSLMKPKHEPISFSRWGLWLILAVVLLATGLYLGREVGGEGLVREGICKELMAGQTPGRQGVVSSIWWGPFPTLAILPMAFLLPATLCLPACLVVSALFGAATLVLLEQSLRMWGTGRWRWWLVLGLALNPAFLEHCWNGSSLPMVTCLLVLSLYSVTAWVQGRRLLDLIWFAFGSALLLGTGYEMSGWVIAAVCVVAIEEWRRPVSGMEKRAVLLVALLPLAYAVALWLLMCWLIMGDPLYAVRSLLVPGPGNALILPDLLWWCHAGLAALVGGMLLLALRRHDRGGVCLTVLGLALPGVAGLMAWYEQLWDAAPLLLAFLPAAVLALGHGLAKREQSVDSNKAGSLTRRTYRTAVILWVLLLLIVADVIPLALSTGSVPGRPRVVEQAASGVVSQFSWLPELERHVRHRTPFAKVFVCGFESFALLQPDSSPVFLHALDFNFDKSKHDYYGQVLYLLIHRPERRNAMDSIHWKYRNIYVQGGKDTLYDSDWGDWRLFELIQAPAPR
jgi:hypothetical protein